MTATDTVVFLSYARTPMGGMQGALSDASATDLGATAVKAAVERAGVAGDDIERIYMGCVLPAGLGQAPARQAAIKAGLPKSVQATTVNKVCGSGMQTVIMGAGVTLICLVVAIAVAYFLARYVSRRWARLALLVIIVPFWSSYLLRVYSWQAILGEKGALNQLLMSLGVIAEPSRLFVYNDIGTFIVLTYVYLPFAILVLYASLERFDYTQLTAAQDLGASPSRAFRHVLLPQIRPGLITAAIFVFIPILGEFLTPSMVGGASGLLIANLIQTFFKNALVPQGAALGLLIVAFVTVLLVIFRNYLRVEDVYARG